MVACKSNLKKGQDYVIIRPTNMIVILINHVMIGIISFFSLVFSSFFQLLITKVDHIYILLLRLLL